MTLSEAQQQRARAALEWPLLLEQIAVRCTSGVAGEHVRALEPAPTPSEAQLRLRRTAQALELFHAGHPVPVRSFPELDSLLERVRATGVASGPELAALISVLGLARDLRVYAKNHAPTAPELAAAVDSDPNLDRLRERLSECIDPSGSVLDRASPELGRARVKVRDAREDLKRRLGQLMGRFADLLQGQYYTEREGRFVLPVRSDAHLRVEGIVLGSSASGGTLFVEPRELTEVGNRLRVAEAEAAREEARVLTALSADVNAASDACEIAFFACIFADSCAATTRWADETASVVVTLVERATLELKAARHPLLLANGVAVVANDIVLGTGRALIISGPNAGGKTVALKTAGLVAWMVRAGLPVPVHSESVVGWFDPVLCDIGDEQSIVRSLSTFSAHIENLKEILTEASPSALVLLDEVAAGTDPEEGAALAGAVLEALIRRGAAVGVTTHYERLKELATTGEGFENASVAFDFERMAPTFRLHLGIAGPSSALAVALRHGLPAAIIERARALLPTQAIDREHALRELSRDRTELEGVQRAAAIDRREARELRDTLEQERSQFREQAAREAERDVRDLRVSVRTARKELEELRARIRSTGADSSVLREIERGVSRVAAQVAIGGELAAFDQVPERAARPELRTTELRVGQTVFHRSLNTEGVIVDIGDREQVRLLIGAMKLTVPIRDLAPAAKNPAAAPKTRTKNNNSATRAKPPPSAQRTHETTLDLRGERVEEGLSKIDSFIDRLMGRSESAGFVLHGHGTGAMKAGVRDHLRASTYVEHSRPAEADEGGDAFTVFWLRG